MCIDTCKHFDALCCVRTLYWWIIIFILHSLVYRFQCGFEFLLDAIIFRSSQSEKSWLDKLDKFSYPLNWKLSLIPTDIGSRRQKAKNPPAKYSYVLERKFLFMRLPVILDEKNCLYILIHNQSQCYFFISQLQKFLLC